MTNNPPAPRKATWRLGARQRERLQWAVVAVICLLLIMAFRPYYYFVIETRDYQTCQSNMLQMAGALGRYKADWDDTLPQGALWQDTLGAYMSPRSGTGFKSEDIFRCPRDKSGSPSSYAWNTLFDGFSETQKSQNPTVEANRAKMMRPGRVPLVLEVHGGDHNKTARPLSWNDVAAMLTMPHNVSGSRTGSIISGGAKPSSLNTGRLANLNGDKF